MATQIPDHIQAFITTALDQLDARYEARITASETRYDKKVEASEAWYDKKIAASEARLNSQLKDHESRFNTKLDQSIAAFTETMDTRIQILFDEKSGVLKAINERLDSIDSKLENTATKDDMYRLEGRMTVIEKFVTATNKDV